MEPQAHKPHVAIWVLAATVILLIAVIALLVFGGWGSSKTASEKNGSQSAQAAVSGTLDINGIIPQGATVSIQKRQYQKAGSYTTVIADIPAVDATTWSVPNLSPGLTYEMTAAVYLAGKAISASAPLVVTAPADNEVFVINIAGSAAGSAVISGTIRVNGYIPSGATITIQGKKLGGTKYAAIAQNLPGDQRQFMSYTTAVAGQSYSIVGLLIDADNKQIGSSSELVVNAPAVNEILTINSQATPPAASPTVTPKPGDPTPTPGSATTGSAISGSINFNGVTPSNARIVIFQKPSGSSNYEVAVDNIQAVDGTTWQWTGSTQGKQYDMIAILKQKQSNGTDTDIATSTTMTESAPASNVQFTINSSVSLSAPGGPISVSCGNESGTTWNAQINFATYTGAQSYWFQVGTTNGGTENANNTANAGGGQNQILNAQLVDGTTYYARYAYANVSNLNAGSSQFSPFSNTTQIRCSR